MKILVYENSSGFSNYSYKLCNEFAARDGIDVYYMTSENNSDLRDLSPRVEALPILENYSKTKKNSLLWLCDRLRVSFSNIRKRNKFLKKNKIDVLSLQSTIPIFDRYLLYKAKKMTKVVYTVHDVIPPVKSFYWSRKSLKKCYTLADELVVHTEGNKKQLVEMFGIPDEKVTVIFHGTDIDYVRYDSDKCREKFGINKKKTVFLFYGGIREQKGLDSLIKAMKGITDSQLVIAGAMPHGESFDVYRELIDKNNVDTVEFIEYIPNEWTDELYQACDVVCLPYKYFYSQSGVFMQSIKYRKPVVVSDVSSFKEYIDKYEMGLLCAPNDPEDLHIKLCKIKQQLSDDAQAFNNRLELAACENSWIESSERYMRLFEQNMRC